MFGLRLGKKTCASAVVLASCLSVTSANAETLKDALSVAYSTNPAIRAEREKARAADEGVAQARSGFLPSVTVQGQAGESQIESDQIPGRSLGNNVNLDPQSINFQATQPIFRGGRSFYGVKAATARARAAHASYRAAEQQFLNSVITVYMDVRRDEESVRIRENNVSVLRKQTEAANARFRAGEGTKTDIAQAQARYSRGIAGLASARSQLDTSRAAYQRIVGQAPGTLDAPPLAPTLPAALDDAVSIALDANPDLIASKLNADAARYGIGVSRAELLPQIDLVAQASDSRESNFSGDRNESTSVVGRVTIPLFDAGLARSQLRQAKIERYRADDIQQDVQRRVIEAVTATWSQQLAARAVEASSVAQVEANEIAFEGVQQEQRVGLRTPLDVLDAEQELLDARLALAKAQRDSYIADHNLIAAYGQLSLETLKVEIGSYNPEKYLRRARRTIISTSVPELRGHQRREQAQAPIHLSKAASEPAPLTNSAAQ